MYGINIPLISEIFLFLKFQLWSNTGTSFVLNCWINRYLFIELFIQNSLAATDLIRENSTANINYHGSVYISMFLYHCKNWPSMFLIYFLGAGGFFKFFVYIAKGKNRSRTKVGESNFLEKIICSCIGLCLFNNFSENIWSSLKNFSLIMLKGNLVFKI